MTTRHGGFDQNIFGRLELQGVLFESIRKCRHESIGRQKPPYAKDFGMVCIIGSTRSLRYPL